MSTVGFEPTTYRLSTCRLCQVGLRRPTDAGGGIRTPILLVLSQTPLADWATPAHHLPRKVRDSNPQRQLSPSPPVFETGAFTSSASLLQWTAAGLEPAPPACKADA